LSTANGAETETLAGASTQKNWRTREMLLMQEVMKKIGQSLAPDAALREMLHLTSELLGLNRGRILLADNFHDLLDLPPERMLRVSSASIRYAYGLTRAEIARGRFEPDEGVTGRVLATGQLIIVQDVPCFAPICRRARFLLLHCRFASAAPP
jgi:Nif-specific regulatory protein